MFSHFTVAERWFPFLQGRNEGVKEGTIPRAPSHYGGAELLRGAPKSPNNAASTSFNSIFASKRPRFEHWGAKLTSCPGVSWTRYAAAFLSPFCIDTLAIDKCALNFRMSDYQPHLAFKTCIAVRATSRPVAATQHGTKCPGI